MCTHLDRGCASLNAVVLGEPQEFNLIEFREAVTDCVSVEPFNASDGSPKAIQSTDVAYFRAAERIPCWSPPCSGFGPTLTLH
jgi:hypothetical protein